MGWTRWPRSPRIPPTRRAGRSDWSRPCSCGPVARPSAAEVDAVLRRLARVDRPAVIRVVADIPLTTWWRADREALRRSDTAAGSEVAGWVRDAAGGYRATPDPVPSATSG